MKHEEDNQLELGFMREQSSASKLLIERLVMPDAEAVFYSNFFQSEESDKIYQQLLREIKWQQDIIKYYGKEIDLPRLTAWYGDVGKDYTYSHIAMNPNPWTPVLLHIKSRIEDVSKVKFNSVLLNLYRSGSDGVSWHSDNEPELGLNPVVASVSFGATRKFQFKHKFKKEIKRETIELTDGSLLIMKGATQQFWLHQVPKTSKSVGPRINLTFRYIY